MAPDVPRPRRVPGGFSASERAAPSWTAGTFEWAQAGPWWRPHWEIRVADDLLAVYERLGWFLWNAAAETPYARWLLRRRGLFGRQTVTREGEETTTLVHHARWFRPGRIERRGGPPLRWRRRGFGRIGKLSGTGGLGVLRRWTVDGEDGVELVRVSLRRGPFKDEGALEITDAGLGLPDLEPLLMLSWCLALCTPRHRAHGGSA
jgi:hypothetical protein